MRLISLSFILVGDKDADFAVIIGVITKLYCVIRLKPTLLSFTLASHFLSH